MSTPADDPDIKMQLRRKAEARLTAGTAPATTSYSLGVDALRLLHTLSSNPDTAADALKLLHELQVHQVELDLQVAQIEAAEHELADELAHFRTAFEDAPFGYFLVDHQGGIIDGNRAGAELFGVTCADLKGRGIDSFLVPESRPLLTDMLKDLTGDAEGRELCAVAGNGDRRLYVLARRPPDSTIILLACCPYPPAPQS